MKIDTGFVFGMGAGLAAGAAVGILMPNGRNSVKSRVEKTVHKMGTAVDRAADEVISELR